MNITERMCFQKLTLHGEKINQNKQRKSNCLIVILELALDSQCDSPGHNARYNAVSAIDTATNKLISFRVVHVKICKYLNETAHYVSFCDFCILCAQSQCHNIKTTLKLNRSCGIYTDTCMFWQKVFAASILPFLKRNCAFNWKTKL